MTFPKHNSSLNHQRDILLPEMGRKNIEHDFEDPGFECAILAKGAYLQLPDSCPIIPSMLRA